jgi:hypothetical protein
MLYTEMKVAYSFNYLKNDKKKVTHQISLKLTRLSLRDLLNLIQFSIRLQFN